MQVISHQISCCYSEVPVTITRGLRPPVRLAAPLQPCILQAWGSFVISEAQLSAHKVGNLRTGGVFPLGLLRFLI